LLQQDVKENTVVAGNPAKFIKRIVRGSSDVDMHHPEIEEQNKRMEKEMRNPNKGLDR
jgi:serine acetyltransferase